jgi:two-component system, LytTR family, sensor kinase
MKQNRIEILILFGIWMFLFLAGMTNFESFSHDLLFSKHIDVYDSAGASFNARWNVQFRIIIDYIIYGLLFGSLYFYFIPLFYKNKRLLYLLPFLILCVGIFSLFTAWINGLIDPYYYYEQVLYNSKSILGIRLERFMLYFNDSSNYIMSFVILSIILYSIKHLYLNSGVFSKLPGWVFNYGKLLIYSSVCIFLINLTVVQSTIGGFQSSNFFSFSIAYMSLKQAIAFSLMSIPFWAILITKHKTRKDLLNAIGEYLIISFCIFSIFLFIPYLIQNIRIFTLSEPSSDSAFFLLQPFLLHPILTAGIPLIIFAFNKRLIRAKQEILAQESKVKTELAFLKSQINPHFLFNSLNTVYGLALEDRSHKTAEGINQLSRMMRFMLHENNSESITLHKEFQYLKDYVNFQRLRLNDDTPVTFNIPDEIPEMKIAPMILIPLVENAFKYGIKMDKNSWVAINLSIKENLLELHVKNSLHKNSEPTEKSEVGINNLLGRLKLMYLEKHTFHAFENDATYEAKLTLELND